MLLIAQKDKEWKTSYHPCLPTTYSSTVSTHNNCFCFKCPITVNQDVNSSLTRLSFSTCSLFIPSPRCSSLAFIASMNEILSCCGYSPAVLSVARPRSPSPLYSLRVTSGVIVFQGSRPSSAAGATWSNIMIICQCIHGFLWPFLLHDWLTPGGQKLCLFYCSPGSTLGLLEEETLHISDSINSK